MCLQLIREGDPVGRKDHPCIWCGEVIPKGEKHHQQVGFYDGGIQDGRYHNECFADAKVRFREGDCDFSIGQAPRPERVTKD